MRIECLRALSVRKICMDVIYKVVNAKGVLNNGYFSIKKGKGLTKILRRAKELTKILEK